MSLISKPNQPAPLERTERSRPDEPTPQERHALDELAKYAVQESRAGKTIPLREYAAKRHLTLDVD